MEVQLLDMVLIIRVLVIMDLRLKSTLHIPVDKRIISLNICSRSFNNWQIQINNSRVRHNNTEMKTIEMVLHLKTEI